MDVKEQYERLLTDLLGVLDAVDQACAHWQEVEAEIAQPTSVDAVDLLESQARGLRATPSWPGLFQQGARATLNLLERLFGLAPITALGADGHETSLDADPGESQISAVELAEMVASGREGAELIQRSLLDALRQQQIIPIPAQGQPFNPKTMFAIGREANSDVPENTVLEEIVRGYQQGEKILREAQVIVSRKT